MLPRCMVFAFVLAVSQVAQGLPARKIGDRHVPTFERIFEANKKVRDRLFQGDILITQEQKDFLARHVKRESHPTDGRNILNRSKRSALLDFSKKWANGRVPYDVNPALNSQAKEAILQAAADYALYTCIRLEPKTSSDIDYVYFTDYGGCWSYIGRVGRGPQAISLGAGCEWKQVVLHEVLHALGFFHEHSRPDRDNYITIIYSNILSGMESNFATYSTTLASSFDAPFNKYSIMQYSNYAFSANSGMTIVSKSDPNEMLGGATALTKIDIDQVNAYYGCSPPPPQGGVRPTTTSTTTQPPTTATASTTRPATASTTTQSPPTTTATASTTRPATASTTRQPPPTTATASTTRPATASTTTQPPSTTTATASTTRPATASTTTKPSTITATRQPTTAMQTSTTTPSRPQTTNPTQPPTTTAKPTTKSTGIAACTQLDAYGYEYYCLVYASMGYCPLSDWMKANCKRTCCSRQYL